MQSQLGADLSRKTVQRKKLEEDSTRDYQRVRFRLFQKIRDEMVPIIEALAKEKGLELVLDMVESVVYCIPAVDMTDEVIKRYNAVKVAKKLRSFDHE